jgi:hypothetical protein
MRCGQLWRGRWRPLTTAQGPSRPSDRPRAVAAAWCNRGIDDDRGPSGLPPVLRWLPKMPGLAPVGRLPTGRIVELPGGGNIYVVDSGPVANAPTFVLLHGLACTGLMMWYPTPEMMRLVAVRQVAVEGSPPDSQRRADGGCCLAAGLHAPGKRSLVGVELGRPTELPTRFPGVLQLERGPLPYQLALVFGDGHQDPGDHPAGAGRGIHTVVQRPQRHAHALILDMP